MKNKIFDIGDGKFVTLEQNDLLYTNFNKPILFKKNKDISRYELYTKNEYLKEWLDYISNNKYPPRSLIYTGKTNKYDNYWEYIDWSQVSYYNILSACGECKNVFYDSFWKIVMDDKTVYVIYFIDKGFGDIAWKHEKMTQSEYKQRCS